MKETRVGEGGRREREREEGERGGGEGEGRESSLIYWSDKGWRQANIAFAVTLYVTQTLFV